MVCFCSVVPLLDCDDNAVWSYAPAGSTIFELGRARGLSNEYDLYYSSSCSILGTVYNNLKRGLSFTVWFSYILRV